MDLRANTAVDVLIGPFVDSTDGNTEETGLTISQGDILLSKNGQALAQKNDDTAAAHDANGYYNCELDATDTNTEGQLVLIVHESGALPVRHEYNVLAEAAWDSLYVAKDDGFMDVNIKTVGRADTQETEANNLESACANYSATRGLTGTAVPAAAADAAGGLPISDAGGLDLDALNSNVSAILTDTGTTLQAELDGIQTDTEDIQTQIGTAGAGLTAVPWNAAWDAEVQSECTDALNAYDPPTKAELDTAVANVSVDEIQASALADLFNTDSGTNYAGAIAGSPVKEIADNAGGGGGDATEANQTIIIGHLTDIKGAGWTDETLESLQTAIEGIGGLTGSNAVTLTIQAPSGTNIVGAFVDVFDSGNTTFIGRLTTNSSGQASFSLDDGTYTIRILKAGYTFDNETLVVDGTEAETYTGTAYAPAAPSEPNICRVYEYAYDPDGTPMSDVKAFAKINTLPYNANSVLYAGQNITAEYDSTTGLLYWDLVQASSVKFVIKDLGVDYTKTIPASSTVRLSDI